MITIKIKFFIRNGKLFQNNVYTQWLNVALVPYVEL